MRLLRYIAGRLLLLLPVLFGTSVLIFLLLRLIPGDPAQVILGLRATPERLAIVRTELGLDLPVHLQYGQWLGKLLQGDLGKGFPQQRSGDGPACRPPAGDDSAYADVAGAGGLDRRAAGHTRGN